jgi:hypothetical protein
MQMNDQDTVVEMIKTAYNTRKWYNYSVDRTP